MVSFMMQKVQLMLIVLLIPLGLLYWYTQHEGGLKDFFAVTPVMHIDGVPLRVQVSATDEERRQGLSGREQLDGLEGMLFVFPESGYHSIWMKDMRFPIDIIWIDESLQIIQIDKEVSPESYPRTYRPKRPAKYVVETNVHFSDTYSFKEGDSVALPR